MAFRGRKASEQRQAEHERVIAQIEEARKRPRTVIRDGQRYSLVRLPDAYPAAGPTGGTLLREREVDALTRAE